MDWSNERYVRIYVRDTTTWKLLTWQARTVLMFMIRKATRIGVIDVGGHGASGLAAMLELPIEIVEPGIAQLTDPRHGTVVERPTAYVLPNYLVAQEAVQTTAHRSREYRGRKRDEALGLEIGVTPRDGEPCVTPRDGITGHAATVTPRDASVTKRAFSPGTPSLRSEPNQTDPDECVLPARAHTIPPSTEHAPEPVAAPPELPRASGPDPRDPEIIARKELGDSVWMRLELLRTKFAHEFGVKLRPLPIADEGRRELAIRLREIGDLVRGEADCDHVLACAEAEAWASPPSPQWLTGSLFFETSWRRKLGMTVTDASRPRAGPRASHDPPQLRIARSHNDSDMPPMPAGMRTKPSRP